MNFKKTPTNVNVVNIKKRCQEKKMPRILDSELKYSAIALCCTGLSRDGIAEKLGIGKGTVSKFLEEFRKEIGDKQYNAIKGTGMFLRKEKISLAEAVSGVNLLLYMEENGIKDDDIHSFLENLREINNVSNVQELLTESVKVLLISKKTGKSFQQIQEQYEELSQSVSDLKLYKNTLQADIKKLEIKEFETLKKNKTTDESLRQFIVIRRSFLNMGVNLAELPQYHDALAEIKRQGFDVENILDDLQELKDLQAMINAKGKYLKKYNQDIEIAKDQLRGVSSELNVMRQKYRHYSYAIKVISELLNKGQDPSIIIHWNQILQHCKMNISEFDSELRKFESMTMYIHKINTEIKSLEVHKSHLKSTVSMLDSRQKQLVQMIDFAQTELDKKIIHATKEINTMHANPLRLVKEDKKPKEVFPILLILFKEMSAWLKKYKIEDKKFVGSIDSIISEIDRILRGK